VDFCQEEQADSLICWLWTDSDELRPAVALAGPRFANSSVDQGGHQMRPACRSHSRVFVITLALCLLAPLLTARAEAGHRRHVSWSMGWHHPFHFGVRWAPAFYVHSYPVGWGPRLAGLPAGTDVGAMRLKVKPKKTEIFLDGEYVGRSGQFDGYPGFLWLDRGSHTLVFYREGYRTFSRAFEVRAGMVTEVRVEMEPGETLPPEQFLPPPRRSEPGRTPAAPRSSLPRPTPPVERGDGQGRDLRAAGARIRIAVEPRDASVYLDGRFLGTGEELSRLHGGLMLDAGEHLLEVVHPEFLTDRTSFRAKEGEEIELRVTLDGEAKT